MRLRDIDIQDISRVMSQLRLGGKSVTTQRRVRAVICRVLQVAIEHRFIVINVAKLAPIPRSGATQSRTRVQPPLSRDEALTLLDEAKDCYLHPILVLAIYTGMRRGEILGLKWLDIDFEANRLQIRRTLREVRVHMPDGKWITKVSEAEPKTKNAYRSLPASKQVMEILRRHKATQHQRRIKAGNAWIDSNYVFTNDIGQPVNPNGVAKQFRRFLHRSGLRHIRFHDLRHTTAVLMLEADAPLEQVSQALGHASISITKDTYASYVPALADRAIGALEDFLSGGNRLASQGRRANSLQ
jgi:integrase